MYKPVQNGIAKTMRSVRYFETKPSDDIHEFVHCFWELKTDTVLSHDFSYHVLPDACVDIVFSLLEPDVATVMTPHTTAEVLNLGKTFHYVGIRFLPGVWRGDLGKIVGGFMDAPSLGSVPTAEISEKLSGSSFQIQQRVLTELVQQLVGEKLVIVNPVITKILKNFENIHNVVEMAKIVNLSPRQLQRTLREATGFSPRDLLKVLRLQSSFGQHYLSLYTDQSHFIHSFRKITGYTPAKYANKFDV